MFSGKSDFEEVRGGAWILHFNKLPDNASALIIGLTALKDKVTELKFHAKTSKSHANIPIANIIFSGEK